MDWKKLHNGSDIRGIALEGVPGELVNLTPGIAQIIGKAFISWLKKKNLLKIRVAVGSDSRLSGPALKKAFIEGMLQMGADVYDCGLASTPAMFMTTKSSALRATAGVMLTASHLPFNRNGLKFFTSSGGLDKNDITQILSCAEEGEFHDSGKEGRLTAVNFIDEYAGNLVEFIQKGASLQGNYDIPLRGFKIVLDAGNGAGGFFAEKVLNVLGADISGSQFLEPDGNFPNHIPNPENADAMNSICQAVTSNKADLGIIFDTDVDRAAIVDHNGNPVNRNHLIALISAIILKDHPGTTIVTDSITSEGLSDFIENTLGGVHHRFKRGYKNVINEALRLNNQGQECHLAIETSGHAALRENYFLDDGAYLVARLLIEMARLKTDGRNLTDLISMLKSPAESREVRFTILENDFVQYGKKVLSELTEITRNVDGWEIVTPNYEGLRVRCSNNNEKGWFLIRMSLHDPVMPLNIESDVTGGVDQIISALNKTLIKFKGLDINVL